MADISKMMDGMKEFVDEKHQGHFFLTPSETQDVLNIFEIAKQSDQLKRNVENLLKQIGNADLCKGCGKEIWWVVHRNGKRVPYTTAGLNHFADCPEAQKFRKAKTP